jgi:hypothetical protein
MFRRALASALVTLPAVMMPAINAIAQTSTSPKPSGNVETTVAQRLSEDGILVSRFPLFKSDKSADAVLTVTGFAIHYSESVWQVQKLLPNKSPKQPLYPATFYVPCNDVGLIEVGRYESTPDALQIRGRYWLKPGETGLTGTAIYRGIKDSCKAQEADHEKQLAEEARLEALRQEQAVLRREQDLKRLAEEERQRQASAAAQAAEFHDEILAAVRAAEEADPFASVRGEFDFSAPDSRQWRTSVRLPNAEKCVLLRNPESTPTSTPVWSFGCTFQSFGDGYEHMVKSVQSVIHLPYQPDEKATNVNRVYFADPSKPAWRLFVARIDDATVGVSVVAVGSSSGAGASFSDAQLFPGVPAQLPTEPTIQEEIERIRGGRYSPVPPAQRTGVGGTVLTGRTTMTVKNSTAYELSVFFDGPVSTKLTLSPGASQDVDLAPGAFHVAGRVAAPNVLPFYGDETYAGSARYSVTFYIGGK